MQLARFLNGVFKKDGFILENADSQNYIIGTPKSDKPIKLKILDKKLHYKLLFHPDLYFGEAYTNGDIVIENGSLSDFLEKKEQTVNQKLCDVRNIFEKYNLISGLHAYYSKNDIIYKNILPPLSILNSKEDKELMDNLEKLNFSTKSAMVA